MKITKFTDLKAWEKAHELVLLIYKTSKNFPREEIYGLTSQMRRCAVSISSNIAEGFSRSTKKDKHYFYTMSKGSLTELQNHLLIAKDLKYISATTFYNCADMTVEVSKLVTAITRSAKSKR